MLDRPPYTQRVATKSILMICGSVRQGSVNAAVIEAAAELVPPDFEAVIYAGIGTLPHFNPDLDHDPLPPQVAELRRLIDESAALLFCTPEYAGVMPGALKNLLEWTIGGVETTQKPTGWINPSSILNRSAGTYEQLKIVLEYTDCRVIERACVGVPVPRALIDEHGHIEDPDVRRAISGALEALAV